MTETATTLLAAAKDLLAKSISYCPIKGDEMRYFQILTIEKVGTSERGGHEYFVAEVKDLDDYKCKTRTLRFDNIVSAS